MIRPRSLLAALLSLYGFGNGGHRRPRPAPIQIGRRHGLGSLRG